MIRWLSKFIFKLFGWKVTGTSPNEVPKSIYVTAPHTSWWDFPIGLLTRGSWNLKVNFVGKKNLFKWPHGFIFRKLGGHPVDRSKNTNLVDEIVNLFNTNERFSIMIAPEGTRKKVSKLKTGFYHIARKANVPIILVTINAKEKQVHFSKPRLLTEDMDAEMKNVWNYFKGVQGVNPDLGIT